MNFFDSWEVATDLVSWSRTWKEEYWELAIRNFEKGMCEWTSQNRTRPANTVHHGKSLQDTLSAREDLVNIE